jgi:type II secretory pathway component GspD/PulD (secretin)
VNDRRAAKLDPEVLSEPVRTRLLERASELDAVYRAGGTVAELRAAAVEAGISARAFDEALAELRPTEDTPLAEASAQPPRRSRLWPIAAGALALIAVGAIGVARSPTPVGAAPPMVEQAFLLRCLSPGQAAELVRPLLDLPANTVVYSPERAAGMLTIRATQEQIENVRSVLNKLDTRSPTCAR